MLISDYNVEILEPNTQWDKEKTSFIRKANARHKFTNHFMNETIKVDGRKYVFKCMSNTLYISKKTCLTHFLPKISGAQKNYDFYEKC